MEPIERIERIAFRRPLRGPDVEAGHASAQIARESFRVTRLDQADVDRIDAFRGGGVARIRCQRDEIRQVQPRFEPLGRETHRIGRRFVDPDDPEGLS